MFEESRKCSCHLYCFMLKIINFDIIIVINDLTRII